MFLAQGSRSGCPLTAGDMPVGAIRVLVVDDSVVVRRLVGDALAEDPDIDVVGTAVDGQAAIGKVAMLEPDLITMDIEMPRLDGVATVKKLRDEGCRTPIIMFSTLTAHGANATLDALAAGASDYVTKPANVGSVGQSLDQVRSQLIPRIKALVPRRGTTSIAPPVRRPAGLRPPGAAAVGTAASAVGAAGARSATRPTTPTSPVELVVIASSTGGPEALARVLSQLAPLPVPVAIVQHMPPVFTAQMANRLDRLTRFTVVEATHDAPLQAGTIHVAPGDKHLVVAGSAGGWRTRLTSEPPENFCRPAADVLFRSAAAQAGAGVLGVVLTGMGQDGCLGSEAVVAAGGSVVAQDEATSVVWGMPGAVTNAGLASAVLPLDKIAEAITTRVTQSRSSVLRSIR